MVANFALKVEVSSMHEDAIIVHNFIEKNLVFMSESQYNHQLIKSCVSLVSYHLGGDKREIEQDIIKMQSTEIIHFFPRTTISNE